MATDGASPSIAGDGIALAVIEPIELEEKEVAVQAGDVLVLYTDGVTEAINQHDEEYGEDRLIQLIKDQHDLSAEALIKKIGKGDPKARHHRRNSDIRGHREQQCHQGQR